MFIDFIDYLASIIKTKAGQFISSEENNLRVTFSAPPAHMLDEIYSRFEAIGPRLGLEHNKSIKFVPVLRVQDDVIDPSHQNTARCSSNHVVAIRTSYGSYLALSTINSPHLLSTDTTANKLGLIRSNHVAFSTWRGEPFVQEVVAAVFDKYCDVPEIIKDLTWEALNEAFTESIEAGDMREAWELLRCLYDLGGDGKSGRDLCHALGVPRLEDDELPNPLINRNIANFFLEHGFNNGIALLREENCKENVSNALQQFSHDLVRLFRIPQRFINRPLGSYVKAMYSQEQSWWHVLSQRTWIELLNQEDSQKLGTLKVSCINSIFRPTLSSQLIAVNNAPQFKLEVDEALSKNEISIFRAAGRKNIELIATVAISELQTLWSDETLICEHEQFIRYEFHCDKLEKPVLFKLISLEYYTPTIVVNCRSAQKLSPFKKSKSGRGAKVQNTYECELVTNGTGTCTLEFFYPDRTILPLNISLIDDEGGPPPKVVPLTTSKAKLGYALAVLDINNDCQVRFKLPASGQEEQTLYVINVSSNEFTSKGASSEFDRLVTNNCTRAEMVARTDVEQSMMTHLEQWILESSDSYLPLVIGPGFKECWHTPSWKERPSISNLKLSLDPRPKTIELTAPASYLEAREKARLLLKSTCEEKGCTIEAISLGQMMLIQENRNIVENYIREYAEWLSSPDSLAVWADLITIHRGQHQSQYLESKPLSVLLSPFHPIRLAWQCNAQHLMQETIKDGTPCPVAGIIDPSSFPDCLALKCRDMDGQFNSIGFAAVKSSSDYWSVLWRTDLISEVSQGNDRGIFGDELGLKIEGMVNGFNKQQVKRSLDEIRNIYSAKNTLRVSLHSDSFGYSSCNEGIDEWCKDNLGPDADEWSSTHGLTLQIIDKRPQEEQPKPAVIASLTERSGTQIRWYTNSSGDHEIRDLSIVDHLQTMDQEFRDDGLLSPVDPSCLSRINIKKNAIDQRRYLSLSRAGEFISESTGNDLRDHLSNALKMLESICVEEAKFDSLGFAPNLQTLNKSLQDTRYCAISSSAVDATCFHSPSDDAYLWDFELPRYAPGAGQSSGFYLIAKQSPTMLTSVRNALSLFTTNSNIDDLLVHSLLSEVSKRGIPTLKRLTSGGSSSLGEVGMLVATRLLQSDFQKGSSCAGLIPAIGNNVINLVIPADVFQPRFDDLRKALATDTMERPDLLVLSIAFGVDKANGLVEPNALKITPIEVKTRSSEMTDKQREDALRQASSFSEFLLELKQKGEASPLWAVAYRDLIASWLDYGFRVYGDTDAAKESPHWIRYHQQVIARFMANKLEIEIDASGRLICIENTSRSRVIDVGKSKFGNVAILDYRLAGALLTGENSQIIFDLEMQVKDWRLLATKRCINEPKLTHSKSVNSLTSTLNTVKPNDSNLHSIDITESTSKVLEETLPEIESETKEGLNFNIGRTQDLIGNKEILFYPGNTELNNINIGVVGDLGTGKTQLLKSLVYQMVKNPAQNRGKSPKVLILDYKRDFSDLEDNCQFIKKAKVKVVPPLKIPLNLFSTGEDKTTRAMLDKIGFFQDILRKIFAVNAPVQDKNLREAIKSAYSNTRESEDRDPTIYDVFKHYELVTEGKADSASAILSILVDYEIFEDDPNKISSFDEFFDGVVAIDLKDLSNDSLKKMVVVIFLNLYFDYMLKVKKQPFIGDSPQTRFIDSYLLVDEAHNIMPYEFEVLTKLLVQGRAFGVGVILASQFFSHFKAKQTNYLEPIGSWFIHKVSGVTARDLHKIGLPNASDSTVYRISGLEKFKSLCKTLHWEGEFIEEVPFYKLD